MEDMMAVADAEPEAHPSLITPADRKAAGKRLRDRVPREAHADWRVHASRADPIGILRAADATRQPDLVPLRYGRMLQSPFTFYRGSAGVMAADLAETPATGIHVQACGDAHLMNFGGFATPERRLIFDINDLDETLARTVGVGRQTARRLVCAGRPRQRARRRGRPRRGGRLRTQLPPQNARLCRRWTCSTSGTPGSTTATFWRCCRRSARRCCASGSPRRRRPAVRSWCFRSWPSGPAGSTASMTPRQPFSMPRRRVPPATSI